MTEKFVECYSHGKSKPAFLCHHLLTGERVGWNEPDEYVENESFEFSNCINAWCDKCEDFAIKTGGWTDESEKFTSIKLVCENCALRFKETNLK